MKTIAFIALVLLSSCASTTRDVVTTGHPFGAVTAVNDHAVDIQFESNRVEGEASGTTVLYIFNLAPSNFSEGLAVQSADDGFMSSTLGALGSMLPSSALGKVKSAAVRAACDEADCDVLGYPMFYIDRVDYLLWAELKVKVVGFPGRILSISNQRHVDKVE